MKGCICPKEVMFTCSLVKTFHVLFFNLLRKKSCKVLFFFHLSAHLISHGVTLDLVEALDSRFQQPQKKTRGGSYTCTDGTLLLRTCALISWTLVMIFFWWPMSVTPSLWMSLHHMHRYKYRIKVIHDGIKAISDTY